jgi:tRNA nucleotidyltransferase/poly(A) polymerase
MNGSEPGTMGTAPLNLAGADWLVAPATQRIFAALAPGGHETRIVGGAVRNALMGQAVSDIDFATTARPEEVVVLSAAAGFKAVPTGIEHGTVTLVIDGQGHEVTTLREDVETDGRHAVVRFGHDWTADALRRDFTVNALSVGADGTVYDPIGGYPDIVGRRIRFIGDADRRIAEDRLRVLRFLRFTAQYGEGAIDVEGLAAAIRARDGLRALSGERVGNEMRRLVVARRAGEIATVMQETGILGVVLAGVGYVAQFARCVEFETALGVAPEIPRRLAVLAVRVAEDVERITRRLRLSNAERDRMSAALLARPAFSPLPGGRTARAALYRLGEEAWRDGLCLAFAETNAMPGDAAWARLYNLPDAWRPPRFPLSGRDVVGRMAPAGPVVGAVLRSVEAWWIAQDFAPDEGALRARLQQELAAAQQ